MLFRRRTTKGQKLIARAVFASLLLIAGIFSYINVNNNSSALAEVNPEKWQLSLGFYDSETNNANTMLTEQNWTLTDENNTPKTRVYTLQINYSATDIDRDYEPGELQIKITLPVPNNASSTSSFRSITVMNELGMEWTDRGFLTSRNVTIAAQKAGAQSAVDYDWQYTCDENTYECVFTNTKRVEKNNSLQGSIQASMLIGLNGNSNGAPLFYPINVEEFSYTTTATLNDSISSNPININFKTEYAVDWKKRIYTVNTAPIKLDSYDGLHVENARDYTWVHYYYYGFNASSPSAIQGLRYEEPYYEGISPSNYAQAQNGKYIPLKDWRWEDDFADDVIVLNADGNLMQKDTDTDKYIVSQSRAKTTTNCKASGSTTTHETCAEIYVGFPKDKYNASLGTNTVVNKVQSKGTYFKDDDETFLDEDSKEVNLSDFELNYNGNDVGLEKKADNNTQIKYENFRTSTGAKINYTINAKSLEIDGQQHDFIVGDDLIYFEDLSTGQFQKASEDDYYFTKITAPYKIQGSNGQSFSCEDHDVEVYYRIKGNDRFYKLGLGGNNAHPCGDWLQGISHKSPEWLLPRNTVEWKVVIPNNDQAIFNYELKTSVEFHSMNVPQHGKVYNFGYIEIQQNGQPLNAVTLDNYGEGPTRDIIAPYDYSTYGHYQQRAIAETEYTGREYTPTITDKEGQLYLPNTTTMTYDGENDSFRGVLSNAIIVSQYVTDREKDREILLQDLTEEDLVKSFESYYLLPAGTSIVSTPEEYANSFESDRYYTQYLVPGLFDLSGNNVFTSAQEYIDYIKSHTTVNYINNWRDSGRQLIRVYVDFTEKPFFQHSSQMSILGYYHPILEVPYDVYAENKAIDSNYTYTIYSSALNDDSILLDPTPHNIYRDDGSAFGEDIFADMNDNGSTQDRVKNRTDSFNILNAVSAEQSIKETVQTDQTNTFTTDDSYASIGSEYKHRLSIRTGNSKAINVVAYDNIEASYGSNDHWQGEFMGIDTSFAEDMVDANGKAIKIKTFYSPNDNAGSLGSDNSWQEYVEGTTDKSNVKSIAFQYLNEDNNSAVLPANAYIYTLIKMKAPTDNDTTSFAYNSFRTEWNAINQGSDTPIEQIEGISSNTTRVQLDHLFDIHVKKVWEDFNNKYNTRPNSITPKLYRDIELVDGQSSINIENGDSALDYHDLHEYYADQYDVTLAPIQCPAGNTTVECYTTTKAYDDATKTYTFTSTLNTTHITVKKIWEDYNNTYGLRPDNVDFTLTYGADTIDTKNLAITGNQDEFNFSDIPTHLIDGHNVALTPFSENYTTRLEKSDDGLTYTFISTLNVEPITVIHRWENDNDVINKRPGDVSFNLIRNSENEKNQPIDKTNDSVEFQFQNLPTAFINDYSVELSSPIEGYTTSSSYDAATHTYTFVSTPDRYTINVKHNWIDNNNAYNLRPTSLDYTLDKNGGESQTATSSSSWTASYPNLPVLDKKLYSIQNVTVPDYSTPAPSYDENTNTYTFISTLTREFDIDVEHYWVDNNNKHNTRPDNVSYDLKKGSDTEDSLSLQSSDGEADSFTGLSLLNEDDYSVPTPTVEHYTTAVTYDSENRKYTFTYTLSDNFDIHVVHEWIDNNNAYGRRPASYDYELLKDSATNKTQSSNSEWKADFTNLPLLYEDSYSVKTPVISYYDTVLKSYDADTHTYVFESTLNEKFDINVVHIWEDNNNTNGFRPGSIDYELTKDGQQDKTQTSSANWTASFPSLPLLDENKYGVTTPTVDHYTTTVNYDPTTHTYTFISTLSDLVDITVEQVWRDQDNHFGLRPDSLSYTLKKGNDNADTLSLSNDSSDKFEGIKLLEIGQYDVPQFNVDNYTVTRNYNASTRSYTFTYELITEPINVKHTWIDDSNALGARPEQINFTLKRGNETEKSNSIATTDNTAQFLFANVPSSLINDFGVSMDEVPFYTTRNLGYDASTHTFSFESTINPLSIKVVNIWVDNHNAHNLRPDSLKFNANDGTSDVDTHTITTANDTENFTFDSLFEYKKDDYEVNLEQNPANYHTEVKFDSETLTYTFTHTLTATFDINVIHIWEDEENKYSTRPDSIEHPLKRNDETTDSKDFNGENSWTNSYTGLPLLNESEFSVPDSETTGYTTTKDYNADTHTYTFTSKLIMTPIKVVHVWDDEGDALGIRPDEVNFSLNNNGSAEDNSTLDTSDKTINTDGFDIAQVPAILIDNYDVTMAPVDFYDTTVAYDPETHTYTFTSRVTPLTITVNNIWEDDNNRAKKRPESLNFILTKDEEKISTRELTTEDNEDSFSFEDLIKYFKDGYNVTLENEPEGYATTVDFDPETMTFTFKHVLKPTPADNSNTGDQITKYLAIFALALAIGLFATKSLKSKKQDNQE